MKINSTRANFTLLRRLAGPLTVALLTVMCISTGCKKDDHPPSKVVDAKLIADNLVSPLGVVTAPDDSKRLFIIDQIGKVWIVDASGNKLPVPFLDVTPKMVPLDPGYDERGLLGLAFHPDYKNNGKFYVYYTLPPRAGGPVGGGAWNNLSRIAEFTVSAGNPNWADIGTERVILDLDDPQMNHNGGTIAFGWDGYLYIAIGDGGGADDVGPGHVEDWYPVNAGGNGQDIEANLFGNILRIDVNGGSPYAIPADNPFVGKPGMDEIWAYGFRNPYRFSFDMGGAHWLYAGDAGQVLYEEIDVVTKGGNYGWNVKEGTHCFNAADNDTELPACPVQDNFGNKLLDPVIELNNAKNPKGGIAVTVIGGNVYRGHDLPWLTGKYIFGSLSKSQMVPSGELFMSTPGGLGGGLWSFEELTLKNHPDNLNYYLKGFGQDWSGEMYLAVSSILGPAGNTGQIWKLVPEKKTGSAGHGAK
ncbi:PQQ-dependent sugar dehydrogenase [Chitinophaga filiformis]|uniref:PQQ-dependent sugar dehydrogenase n=1 Tax=Chitinophaga filiformis TaxID=104663 RepID=UPI001F20B496|nr:PQQ-dependent sugar dehydrogenase [Chitinophaga filiformis]MCF6404579.1 PQQ-dependent sugar dehydrogenase [Chitinophaga filiformis]